MIRRNKTAHCQKVLQENLLILNSHLREPLIRLRELCYLVSNWNIFKIDRWQTATLQEFFGNQRKQRETVSSLLDELGSQVRDIVLEACDVDLREFLIANGFRTNTAKPLPNGDGSASDEDSEEEHTQKISHAEKAAIRTEVGCCHLPSPSPSPSPPPSPSPSPSPLCTVPQVDQVHSSLGLFRH